MHKHVSKCELMSAHSDALPRDCLPTPLPILFSDSLTYLFIILQSLTGRLHLLPHAANSTSLHRGVLTKNQKNVTVKSLHERAAGLLMSM